MGRLEGFNLVEPRLLDRLEQQQNRQQKARHFSTLVSQSKSVSVRLYFSEQCLRLNISDNQFETRIFFDDIIGVTLTDTPE